MNAQPSLIVLGPTSAALVVDADGKYQLVTPKMSADQNVGLNVRMLMACCELLEDSTLMDTLFERARKGARDFQAQRKANPNA